MFAYPLGGAASAGGIPSELVTLTDAATIAVDLSTGRNFQVTLGGNRTLGNPTNQVSGAGGILIVKQDGTPGRTLSFGSNYKFLGNLTPTLQAGANGRDLFSYFVESNGYIILYRWGTI
jgi:hypothetical protein